MGGPDAAPAPSAPAPAPAPEEPEFSLAKALCGDSSLLLIGNLAVGACLLLHLAQQYTPVTLGGSALIYACAALAVAPFALDAAGLAQGALALVLRASRRARAPRGALLRSLPGPAGAGPGASAPATASAAAAPALGAGPRRLAVGARVRLAARLAQGGTARELEGELVGDDGPAHALPYLVAADCGELRLCSAGELAVLREAPGGGAALAVGDRVRARRGGGGGGGVGRVARVALQGPLAPAQRYLVQSEVAGSAAWAWHAAEDLELA